MASFNITVKQMTEMFQRKKSRCRAKLLHLQADCCTAGLYCTTI